MGGVNMAPLNHQLANNLGRLLAVAASPTATSIPAQTVDGDTAAFVASQWKGGYIFWLRGSANAGTWTAISDNTTSALTVPTMGTVAVKGDPFVIFLGAQVNVTVSAPENIAQVGGTNVPSDQGGTPVVPIRSSRGAFTDGSGTIAAGDTSQQVFAANTSRAYLLIQNVSSDSLWINFGTAAVQSQPSIELLPNATYTTDGSFIETEAVNVIGATTGDAFVAKQA